ATVNEHVWRRFSKESAFHVERIGQRRQNVEVDAASVRGVRDVECIGHKANLETLGDAPSPPQVRLDDVDRAPLEQRPELALAVVVPARGDRYGERPRQLG